jgi:PleD family two-component response regulator
LIQDISEKSAPEIVARVQLMNAELSKATASTPATSVSAGVAFSIQGFTLRLYKKADTALYYTKNTTRCGCTVYRDELGLKTDKD